MPKFIGRKRELTRLKALLNKKKAHLIILKGRRRIGKSRLLKEFGKVIGHVHVFTGLAPDKDITAKQQREEFARQLGVEFGLRGLKTEDWGDLFWHLAEQVKTGRVLVVLDEVSWMAQDDPTFLPKLKVAWESYFMTNSELILALCSSISMWIDENILSSTGFVGRQSLTMTLKELRLDECGEFWDGIGSQVSAQEKLLTLAVTGGVPRYLEEIDPQLSAEQNIKALCFSPEGILLHEFNQIFSDLFGAKQALYRNICESLAYGPADAQTVFERTGMKGSGDDYQCLQNLTLSGFISRDYSWHIRSGEIAKIAWYRLSDNYCRFYLKYILPSRERIELDSYSETGLVTLSGWSTIAGLQMENLILNNRALIQAELGISQQEIICDNPYTQRATKARKGCQIDYLIQTRFNTLYVCELKYSKDPVSGQVIDEVKQKIAALGVKSNFSVRPVLIHCNSVSEAVLESGFFAKIIDFAALV
ncbi:MAG: ATPase [Legionellales bacterium]|nr:ATPase [Legionellales bacterium]|tara:strand:+ start:8660 stop:10090 length:1431 start_codon:yes stop_codon:yes gene_type:complete